MVVVTGASSTDASSTALAVFEVWHSTDGQSGAYNKVSQHVH